MADQKISQLNSLLNVNLIAGDLLPIVDVTIPETKKISVSELDSRWKTPVDSLAAQVADLAADVAAVQLSTQSNLVGFSTPGNINAPTIGSYIFCDPTAGSQTVTLPVAAANPGLRLTIVRTAGGANTLTIVGTINGVVDDTIEYQFTARTVLAFGGAWYYV